MWIVNQELHHNKYVPYECIMKIVFRYNFIAIVKYRNSKTFVINIIRIEKNKIFDLYNKEKSYFIREKFYVWQRSKIFASCQNKISRFAKKSVHSNHNFIFQNILIILRQLLC